jgi:hypothetical protein
MAYTMVRFPFGAAESTDRFPSLILSDQQPSVLGRQPSLHGSDGPLLWGPSALLGGSRLRGALWPGPDQYGVEGPCCSIRPAGTVVTAIAALGAVSAVMRLRSMWNTRAGDWVRCFCLPTSAPASRSRTPSLRLRQVEYGERMVLTRFFNCG